MSTHSLGAMLERDRLEHRVGRVAVAVAALRQLAVEHEHDSGSPRRHIRPVLADFEAQMVSMQARLHALARDRGSTPLQEGSSS
ncbi:MAG TPA: hypothetical protein VG295_02305 [Solirubrobacteraceae bacterium]|jgi:hypothetical protein|nr:hypothetical protein [Solirubrobacteraceae bacterium]